MFIIGHIGFSGVLSKLASCEVVSRCQSIEVFGVFCFVRLFQNSMPVVYWLH